MKKKYDCNDLINAAPNELTGAKKLRSYLICYALKNNDRLIPPNPHDTKR